jgi:tartrate dehydratase beta subunit/fumarate hydratase class I family protein
VRTVMVITHAIPVANAFIATRTFWQTVGMEAIRRIEAEDFPTFMVINDKGNDFFKELNLG